MSPSPAVGIGAYVTPRHSWSPAATLLGPAFLRPLLCPQVGELTRLRSVLIIGIVLTSRSEVGLKGGRVDQDQAWPWVPVEGPGRGQEATGKVRLWLFGGR